MIEFVVLLLIISFCLIKKAETVVYLIILLLPFHDFIKSCFHFFLGGGEVFAYWKELAILILLGKVILKKGSLGKGLYFVFILYIIYVFLYTIFVQNIIAALPSLRDYTITILLLIGITGVVFKENNPIQKILFIVSIAVLIHCIIGFVQMFYMNEYISVLMGRVTDINNSGYIVYATASARILGYERMAGIAGGGPNGFGLYLSLVIIVLYSAFIQSQKLGLTKQLKRFMKIAFILSVFCLILSFSRAGWAISLIGIILVSILNNIKIKLKYVISVLFISIGVSAAVAVFYPQAVDIISATFEGKEASAAARGNNIASGLDQVLGEPWGHGVGTTDLRYRNVNFYTESSFLNLAYEIGIQGVLFFILMIAIIGYAIYCKKFFKKGLFTKIAIAILIPSLIACFVSVNPFGMPYIFFWWLFMGLGLNKSINTTKYYLNA